MNEHRDGEVTNSMRQVVPYRLDICCIVAVIGGDFNGATIGAQTKVMSRLVMRKSHRLITMFFQLGLMIAIWSILTSLDCPTS